MKNRIITVLIGIGSLLNWGCTDLEEQILDETLDPQTDNVVSSVVAPAYGPLVDAFTHTKNFGLQLIPTDQGILPPRGSGNDWYDGGKYIELHQHNITTGNVVVKDTWDAFTLLLSRTITAIETLSPIAEAGDAEAQAALYEMRALRAYYNMLMLDYWGIAFKKDNAAETSEIFRRDEAISYIESEFLDVVDHLSDANGPGRVGKSAVNGFLAQLYMNAAVYRDPYGTPNFTAADMDKVILYTNKVLNEGSYAMSPEYFEIFDDENHTNPEIIFAIDQRPEMNTSHNRLAYWSLSGSVYPLAEFTGANGTDGPAITPEFYQTWIDAYGNNPENHDGRFFKENIQVPTELQDLTGISPANDENHYFLMAGEDFHINRGILRGVQWGLRNASKGQPFYVEDGLYKIYPVIEQRDGYSSYVDYTILVDLDNPENKDYSDGYRVEKYEFSRYSDSGRNKGSADIVLLRLADIYLMRAEAYLRKGDAATALADVNFVRASRTARPEVTAPALSTINLDLLYRERGFEFYWEYLRRTDMIRFGHYEDSYTSKSNTDVTKRLFPIPQNAIDGASGTPGYLVQNEGY